mmetsp:Transcript_50913/g.45710  ORF Transcript_50913/g.45710 Transcript_50913/m.45710 type:complete len:103 (-) Transcript_50913:192-500(-)
MSHGARGAAKFRPDNCRPHSPVIGLRHSVPGHGTGTGNGAGGTSGVVGDGVIRGGGGSIPAHCPGVYIFPRVSSKYAAHPPQSVNLHTVSGYKSHAAPLVEQ